MYDLVTENKKRNAKLKNLDFSVVTDLPDLSTPEVSFDLQSFIEGSNQVPTEALLADLYTENSSRHNTVVGANIPSVNFGFSMPQSAGFGSDRYGSEAGVKQEPTVGIESHGGFTGGRGSSTYPFAAGLPQLPDTSLNSAGYEHRDIEFGSSGNRTEDKKSKKAIDKASDEYRRRRERNNIAVRKSREKAKQRCKDTERRVCDLVSENDKLRKRVELLNKELSVLKNLLSNVGVPPDPTAKGLD